MAAVGSGYTSYSKRCMLVGITLLFLMCSWFQENTFCNADGFTGVHCPGVKSEDDDDCQCSINSQYYCPPGNYCPSSTEIFECTLGFYCPENSTQPIYCCDGYYCEDPSSIEICPEGSFCREGSIEPKDCAPLNSCPEGSDKQVKSGLLVVFTLALITIGTIF